MPIKTYVLVVEKGDSALQLLSKPGERKYQVLHFHSCNQALHRIFKNHIAAAVIEADSDFSHCADLVKEIKNHSNDIRIIIALQDVLHKEVLKVINLGIYGLIDIQNSKNALYPMVISAIKEYENQRRLTMTQLKYHELFHNLQEAIISLDSQGKIIECNPSFTRLTGYSQKELQQMTIWKITPPRWCEMEQELFKKLPTNGSTGSYEKEFTSKDGDTIPVEVSAHIIKDGAGQSIGIWALTRDIRKRKKRERENINLQTQITHQQRALIQLSRLSNVDLNISFQQITEKSSELLNIARVGIWMLNKDKSQLECIDLYEHSKQQHSSGTKLASSKYPKYFKALGENRIIAAHYASSDPFTSEFKDDYLIPLQISSMLDCAIRHHGEVVGVICHEHIGEPRLWSLEEQNFAASLADTIALVLENHERLETEKSLVNSEERYRSIFYNSPVAIMELDFSEVLVKINSLAIRNGKTKPEYMEKPPDYFVQQFKSVQVSGVNPAALQLCEATDKHEIISSLDSMITSEAASKIKEILIAILQGKKSIEGETIIRTVKGNLRTISYHISLPKMQTQQNSVLFNLVDISERRQAEDALRMQKEFSENLIQTANVLIVGLDTQGNITVFNRFAQQNTGYTQQELNGRNWFEVIVPRDRYPQVWEIFSCLPSGKLPRTFENPILTKSGEERIISWQNSEIKQNGNITGSISFGIDITERKQAEENLNRKLQEITVLHGITVAGTDAVDIDHLIERTTQLLGETLYSNNFGIFLFDGTNQIVYPHSSYRGLKPEDIGRSEPATKGITGRVIRSGKAQRVPDVKEDPDYLEIDPTTQSELAVPIIVNGQLFGIINTESTMKNAYSKADEELLITYANQLAIFIEKIKLAKEQQRQTREITALYETAVAISGLLDVEKLLNRIYLQASDLFSLDTFLVAFKEEETEEITVAMAMENNRVLSEWVDQRFPCQDSGLTGWVIQNRKSLLLKDLKKEKLPVKPKMGQKPARSWLGVPLMARGQAIGAISVQSFQPDMYNGNNLHLLEAIASQVAAALDNARLVEQTQNRLQRLAALHDIDLVINSSLDLRVTLNILLDQVIEKLKVDAATVMLLNPRTQLLEYSAGRGFRTRNIENYQLRLGEGLSGKAAMERHLMQTLNLSDLDQETAYPELLREEGFLSYYSVPLIAKGQVKGVLDIFDRDILTPDQEWVNFLETLAGQAAIAIDNTTLLEDLHRSNIELTLAYDNTLEGWSRALDLRDRETEGHTQRAVELTLKIAQNLGMSDEELIHVRRGALLHDIGKMGIPDEILFKPGPLTDQEWTIMRRHPVMAYELLYPINYLRPALEIPYCHHERWDGTGYPRSLKGEEIPLAARIFSVVDVWDALISDRPYRKAWTSREALNYIQEQKGKQFDPKIVEIFMVLVRSQLINE